MEILFLILKFIGTLLLVLGLPILLAHLARQYVFKTEDWRTTAVFFGTLFGAYYLYHWNDVSFLGYLDWALVTMLKIGLPIGLAHYLHNRFFRQRWAFYLILVALLILMGLLVNFVLNYFGIRIANL